MSLPYIYKNKFTLDDPRFIEIIKEELSQRRKIQQSDKKSQDNLEEILRLEFSLNNEEKISDNFEIKRSDHLFYCKWKAENLKEVLIYLNGIKTHAGRISGIANNFMQKDIVVYGLDRRATGLNMRISGDYQDWITDVSQVVGIARKEHPNSEINLISFSFGARIASAYAIQNPDKIASLIYLSPGFKTQKKFSLTKKLKIGFSVISNIPINIRTDFRENKENLEKNYLENLENDKLRIIALNANDYYQAKLINNYVLKNLEKIKNKSLVVFMKDDEVIDNEKTKSIINRFKTKPTILEYPDYNHSSVFFGDYKNRLINDVCDFLKGYN